jgi:hypothetical protein
VGVVAWWEDDSFGDEVAREAAELVAFEKSSNPRLRVAELSAKGPVPWLTIPRSVQRPQIHEDGTREVVSLFNLGGPPGSERAMLRKLVEDHNVTRLDCFGDGLRKLYETLGFEVTEKMDFDDQYAPSGWNYDMHGRPPVYVMERPGGSKKAKVTEAQLSFAGKRVALVGMMWRTRRAICSKVRRRLPTVTRARTW